MAVPEGRGYGGPEDDYYALGVLVLVLLCGGNPVPGLSEHELVEAKISKGSYAALVGETRLSLPMVEVLRSEEHTSELQSLMRISYAVFCLKKKTTTPVSTNKLPVDI